MQSLSVHAEKIPKEVWEAIWKLPDEVSISDWVERNIVLSEKMAARPGPLSIASTPYVRGIYDAWENPFLSEIILVWGRQMAKSTTIHSLICYMVAQDPGPATFLLPTKDKAKEVSETKLDSMFQACPEIQKKMPLDPDDYTKLRMNFLTMQLAMAWAGSESQTTTRSNRYLIVDEEDEIKKQVGKNAIDPLKGLEQTTKTFYNRKIIKTSTPTTPEGRIWQDLKACQFVFELWISCSHCETDQILYWENLKFGDDHDPYVVQNAAFYECEHCHGRISNIDKIRALGNNWRARLTPDPCGQIMKNVRTRIEETVSLTEVLTDSTYRNIEKIGFHLPSWYGPFDGQSFGVVAKEFLEAHGSLESGSDFAPMRNWIIYNAAKPWEQVAISVNQIELVKNEIDLPSLVCPNGTIALTAGIDPGKGDFWYVVLAWKPDEGPHLVEYGHAFGDYETSDPDIGELVRNRVYQVEGEKRQLHIWRAGIDTGGGEFEGVDLTMTAAAYEWIRKMRMRGLYGTKGLSRDIPKRLRPSKIDKMPGDKRITIPGGLTLIEINTDAMKDLIHFRLNRNVIKCPACKKENRFSLQEFSSDPPIKCTGCGGELEKRAVSGLFTFYKNVEEQFFEHLLAEEPRMNLDGKYEWVRIRHMNHLLDCTVIAFAMADSEFGGGIRVIRQPPSGTQGDPTKLPPVNPITKQPKGSWIKQW